MEAREVEGGRKGGGKNNLGLTERGRGPLETDDLAHSLVFSGRCCGRKRER